MLLIKWAIKKKLKQYQQKDLIDEFSFLNGGKYFFLGIFQTYLVFIATKKNIRYFSGTTRVERWKSNGM